MMRVIRKNPLVDVLLSDSWNHSILVILEIGSFAANYSAPQKWQVEQRRVRGNAATDWENSLSQEKLQL